MLHFEVKIVVLRSTIKARVLEAHAGFFRYKIGLCNILSIFGQNTFNINVNYNYCNPFGQSFETFNYIISKPLKVMKSQNEYMKSSHCPNYEQNIREISAMEDYIDYTLFFSMILT